MKLTREQKLKRAARKAARAKRRPRKQLTPADEVRLDLYLTFIIVLQEVTMRYVALVRDNPALAFKLKQIMNKYVRAGYELNEVFRKYIRADPYHDDPEELMDIEADRIFDLVNATATISSDEQWLKAISAVQNIAGFKESMKPQTV